MKRVSIDIDEAVERLLECWSYVNRSDTKQGLEWYAEAQRFCVGIAELTGIEYTRIAAVVAVTSPNTFWTTQQWIVPLIIKAWLEGKPASEVGFTFQKSIIKAFTCLEGDFSVISGNKVKAFFANICGDTSAVTIDRWAARLALGDYTVTRFNPALYDGIAEAYRRAANKVGWTGRDFQATLWVYAKRVL